MSPSIDEIAGGKVGKMAGVMTGVFILCLGGIGIILGVRSLVKEKSILGLMILGLSCGALFVIVPLLDLEGLLDSQWTLLGVNAVVGIICILMNITELYSPSSQKVPRWTHWAGLVIGAVLVLCATVSGWYHYWH